MTFLQDIANFNWFDYTILGVIVISTLISLIRGFVKELVSLLTWVVGFWFALRFYTDFANILEGYINSQPVRTVVSFVMIFIIVLIFGAIFNYLISLLLIKTGLNGTDRLIGMLFGLTRGVLLIGVVLLLLSTTATVQDAWWKKSVLIPHFKFLVDWLHGMLPQKFSAISSVIPKST